MTVYILPMDAPTATELFALAAGLSLPQTVVRTTACGYAVPDSLGAAWYTAHPVGG